MTGSKLHTLLVVLGTSWQTLASPSQQTRVASCLTKAWVPQAIPGTMNFTQGIVPYNLRLPFTPVALAIPSTVAQVESAVSCASKYGVKVSARSGGHSYASHGIGGEDGHLVVDLKLFNAVNVDNETNIATIGPGARLGNVAIALFNQGGRAISHGVCPGVGVGGHVLHGGYGLLSHTHGLALDFLVEAEVVLADGKAVKASKSKNSDLFWALRGAGSSFGIVTDMKFRTIAAPSQSYLFYYAYNWTSTEASSAFLLIQEYTSSGTIPREMNMRIVLGSLGGNLIWLVEGVYYGSEAGFQQAAGSLIAGLGPNILAINSTLSWLDSLLYANNNDLLPGMGSGEPLETPLDYNQHSNFFGKSLMTGELTPSAVEKFIQYLYNQGVTSSRPWFAIIALHGGPTSAVSQVPAEETSFAHRHSLLTWEFMDLASNGTYPADGFIFLNEMVGSITAAMGNVTLGNYHGYADPTLTAEEAHRGYWLGHYEKLARIKKTVDPYEMFSNPQAVLSG